MDSAARPNSTGASELRALIEDLERLEAAKKEIIDDIKTRKLDAKARGWSVKAVEKIIKERAEDETARARRKETEQLTDVYRAALGMLDGTPLGDAARERLSRLPEQEQPAQEEPANPEPETSPETIAEARESGKAAQRDGKRVTDNPYVAGDPRRAAWDEGWCYEAGSDGMDIPKAWRRNEEKKSKKPGDGSEGQG